MNSSGSSGSCSSRYPTRKRKAVGDAVVDAVVDDAVVYPTEREEEERFRKLFIREGLDVGVFANYDIPHELNTPILEYIGKHYDLNDHEAA